MTKRYDPTLVEVCDKRGNASVSASILTSDQTSVSACTCQPARENEKRKRRTEVEDVDIAKTLLPVAPSIHNALGPNEVHRMIAPRDRFPALRRELRPFEVREVRDV